MPQLAKEFWETSRFLEMWSNTVLVLTDVFSIKTKNKEKRKTMLIKSDDRHSWFPLFKLGESLIIFRLFYQFN